MCAAVQCVCTAVLCARTHGVVEALQPDRVAVLDDGLVQQLARVHVELPAMMATVVAQGGRRAGRSAAFWGGEGGKRRGNGTGERRGRGLRGEEGWARGRFVRAFVRAGVRASLLGLCVGGLETHKGVWSGCVGGAGLGVCWGRATCATSRISPAKSVNMKAMKIISTMCSFSNCREPIDHQLGHLTMGLMEQ